MDTFSPVVTPPPITTVGVVSKNSKLEKYGRSKKKRSYTIKKRNGVPLVKINSDLRKRLSSAIESSGLSQKQIGREYISLTPESLCQVLKGHRKSTTKKFHSELQSFIDAFQDKGQQKITKIESPKTKEQEKKVEKSEKENFSVMRDVLNCNLTKESKNQILKMLVSQL